MLGWRLPSLEPWRQHLHRRFLVFVNMGAILGHTWSQTASPNFPRTQNGAVEQSNVPTILERPSESWLA